MQETNLADYGIELKDAEVQDNNDKTLNWVFKDSKFLPLENLDYVGTGEVKGKTGNEIPVHIFLNGTIPFIVSKWNKEFVMPLPLEKTDKCKIYRNKDDKLEILKLN